jgi:hypothetical protein
MEKLSETGKRFERLLYSSIFIIFAGVIFYYLSSAISEDNNQKKHDLLIEYRNYLTSKKMDFARAYETEKQFEQYSEYNKSKSDKERSDKLKKDTERINEINKAREKLELTPLNNKEELKKIESLELEKFPLIDIEKIKLIGQTLALDKVNSITDAENIYQNAYRITTINILISDREMMEFFLEKRNVKIDDIINEVNKKLDDLNNGMVKVFNVDTPIQFPFSLGDMKSKVSLYNIQAAGVIIMPILLVIWLGALTMTRAREIYYIRKYKRVMDTYPHVLNIYYIIDRELCKSKKDQELYFRLLFKVDKDIKEAKLAAVLSFLVRSIIGLTFFCIAIIPFYYGALFLNTGHELFKIYCLGFFMIINIVQAFAFLIYEASLSNIFFIIDGECHESI